MFGRSLGVVGRISVAFLEIYFDLYSFESHFRAGAGILVGALLALQLHLHLHLHL